MNWDLPHDDMQIKCASHCFIFLATVFIEETIFLQNVVRQNLFMTSILHIYIFNVRHAGSITSWQLVALLASLNNKLKTFKDWPFPTLPCRVPINLLTVRQTLHFVIDLTLQYSLESAIKWRYAAIPDKINDCIREWNRISKIYFVSLLGGFISISFLIENQNTSEIVLAAHHQYSECEVVCGGRRLMNYCAYSGTFNRQR